MNFKRLLVSFFYFALTVVFQGCATYTREDLKAPTADFSGGWYNLEGNLVTFKQSGTEATAAFRGSLIGGAGDSVNCTDPAIAGRVEGRVFHARQQHIIGLFGPQVFPATFTLSPDGKEGTWDIPFLHNRRLYRIEKGPASEFGSLDASLPDTGGIVCQLPVSVDGMVSDPAGTYVQGADTAVTASPQDSGAATTAPVREVVVSQSFVYRNDGELVPAWAIVPVTTPRKVRLVAPGSSTLIPLLPIPEKCLRARTQGRYYIKQEISIDGKRCWVVAQPTWRLDTAELRPTVLTGEIYESDPDQGARPIEVVRLALRSTGDEWRAGAAYVLSASRPTSLQPVFEKTKLSRIDIKEMDSPPLDGLISPEEQSVGNAIRAARWRTRMLVLAKNLQLPRILRESKTGDLTALENKTEQAILDYSHESELLKDKAARSIEAGTENANSMDVDRARELALAYKEKVEVLKALLGAIKEEIGNRGK